MAKKAGDKGLCFEKPPSKENPDDGCVDELPWVQMKKPKKYARNQDGFTGAITTQETTQEEPPKQELFSHGSHDNQGEN